AVNQRVYEVIGTEGLIRAPRAYRPDEYGGEAIVTLEKDKITQTERLYGDQYCLEVEHISEAILSGNTDLKHDFENSIQNMKVMDACFESIQTGKKAYRSEEHTSELQSRFDIVCRLLLEKKLWRKTYKKLYIKYGGRYAFLNKS